MRYVALVLVALALTGCETTAEKSAKLEKQAKRVTLVKQKGLSIGRQSTVVKVASATIVHGSEGAAAVLTLRNSSSRALREVPIAISVKDGGGASLYTNDVPGLASTLTSAALLPAHGRITWIDDQIQASATAKSVSAKIGEGAPVAGTLPQIEITGAHLYEDPANGTGAEGTVTNGSRVTQQELVVYAVARRGGRIVAAGRAVVASLPAGSSVPVQVFFVGDPKGAQLELSAPPTTLG